MIFGVDVVYNFLIGWTNSWPFRVLVILTGLLSLLTLLYSITEARRMFRSNLVLDDIANRLFLLVSIVFQTLMVFLLLLFFTNTRFTW